MDKKKIDFTCIGIIKNENIIDIINPFEINDDCYDPNDELKDYDQKGVVVAGINHKNNIDLPQGFMEYVNNLQFLHDCNTESGFSGGPIILIKNLKLIGVHIGYFEKKNKNIGIFFHHIIKNLNDSNLLDNTGSLNNENKKFNYIEGILDFFLGHIYDNDNELLFTYSSNEKIDVYLNDEKIEMIKEENKWKINFKYFKKNGIFKFKITFQNNLNNLSNFFKDCRNISSIDFSNFNSSDVTDMSYMFSECELLKEIKGLNKLKTDKVVSMKGMFKNCLELEYLDISEFNTSNVTDVSEMFSSCIKLKEIEGINNFKSNKVTNMFGMFIFCREIEYLDLSSFNTSNVTDMGFLFAGCNKLRTIFGIEKFNTNKVGNMQAMFLECSLINYLDLTNFDTSNVNLFQGFFSECINLKEVKGLNKFNTKKVTNMDAMFQLCKEIEFLDLSSFDTSNVTDMTNLFTECHKLKKIKGINNFKANQVKKMKGMFNNLKEIECLDLSNFNTDNVIDMNFMFNRCSKLK